MTLYWDESTVFLNVDIYTYRANFYMYSGPVKIR
jgi:hypothetical protein